MQSGVASRRTRYWGGHSTVSKKMPPHFAQCAAMGTGSKVVVTARHVEQSQLRLRIRSSRPATWSGGPRKLDNLSLVLHGARCSWRHCSALPR